MITSSVARTATDALNSKLSLLSVGYSPIPRNCDIYRSVLETISQGLEGKEEEEEGECGDGNGGGSSKKRKKRRRQTPLVNAGYAARISIVSTVVERFILYHAQQQQQESIKLPSSDDDDDDDNNAKNNKNDTKNDNNVINIVLIGCGMDALGLWASSLSPKNNVQVYEIDCEENCTEKARVLTQTKLLISENDTDINVHGTSCYGNQEEENQSSKMKQHHHHQQQRKSSIVASGYINISAVMKKEDIISANNNDDSPPPKRRHQTNYHLLSCNLSNNTKKHLQNVLSESTLNINHPTIVISELVLAYLNTACNNLLEYISSELIVSNNNSLFVAYEPIGGDCGINNGSSVDYSGVKSVVGGYANDYYSQFISKLARGNHHHQQQQQQQQQQESNSSSSGQTLLESSSSSLLFQPLGYNCKSVVERFKQCGFSGYINCRRAGVAAAAIVASSSSFNGNSFGIGNGNMNISTAPEPFDEHAALALHLKCYAVACAFSPSSSCCGSSSNSTKYDYDMIQAICPWFSRSTSRDQRGSDNVDSLNQIETISSDVQVSTLSDNQYHGEDIHIQHLFQKTYSSLSQEYSAVRKMVRTALKTDLLHDDKDDVDDHSSSISARYREWGGEFWVATIPNMTDFAIVNSGKDESKEMTNRTIVGCIGVRPRTDLTNVNDGKSAVKQSHHSSHTFEIHRLAVDDEHRGKGIGRALISAVEEYITKKISLLHENMTQNDITDNNGNDGILNEASTTVTILATTPKLLVAACGLYSSCGFELRDEVCMGQLIMRTYAKISHVNRGVPVMEER